MDTSDTIKEKAKGLFFSYGLKSISMDDIAKKSGVSKRTIYQFFEDKNDLISAIIEDLIQSHENLFEFSQTIAKDPIDEVLKQDQELLSIWTGIQPSLFYGLEKYFPRVFELLNQSRLQMLHLIIDNLKRGKQEGHYREDVDIILISDLRMHQMLNVLRPGLLTSHQLTISKLATEYTVLYLHSITTEKGKTLLYKYLNQNRK